MDINATYNSCCFFFFVNASVVTLIDESIDMSIVSCVNDKGVGQGDAH